LLDCSVSFAEATGALRARFFGKPLLLERVTTNDSPGHMVAGGDRLHTDRKIARNVGCDFIYD
jgi:hypothetical protein